MSFEIKRGKNIDRETEPEKVSRWWYTGQDTLLVLFQAGDHTPERNGTETRRFFYRCFESISRLPPNALFPSLSRRAFPRGWCDVQ